MFGLFGRRKQEPIVFGSAEAAFDYACAHLENALLLEAVVPALVEERGRTGEEGERYFRIRLANRDGGRVIDACVLGDAIGSPAVGDLIGFRIVRADPDLSPPYDIIGFIAYGLGLTYVPGRGWPVVRSFVPDNLKPTIRF